MSRDRSCKMDRINKPTSRHLLEDDKRFRLLTERITDVIWALDLHTFIFEYVSPSVEALLDYRPEEIIGFSVDKFF